MLLCAQSCLTLCDPMDCTPPGSSVHGILQARILEWIAISFFRGIFPTQGLNPCLLGLLHWLESSFFFLPLQFSSVTQSCPTLCDPMNRSTPGLSVHHHPLASWKPSCLPHHYCGRGWACVLDARLLQGETEVRLSPQPRAHRSPAIWNPRRTWATRSDGPRKPGAAAWKVWLATRRRTS